MASAVVDLVRISSRYWNFNFLRFGHPQSGGLELLHIRMAYKPTKSASPRSESRNCKQARADWGYNTYQ